eukprot:SAG11_NODE_2581_length_3197_cov_3.875403_1_plen_178_part_00
MLPLSYAVCSYTSSRTGTFYQVPLYPSIDRYLLVEPVYTVYCELRGGGENFTTTAASAATHADACCSSVSTSTSTSAYRPSILSRCFNVADRFSVRFPRRFSSQSPGRERLAQIQHSQVLDPTAATFTKREPQEMLLHLYYCCCFCRWCGGVISILLIMSTQLPLLRVRLRLLLPSS